MIRTARTVVANLVTNKYESFTLFMIRNLKESLTTQDNTQKGTKIDVNLYYSIITLFCLFFRKKAVSRQVVSVIQGIIHNGDKNRQPTVFSCE